MDQVKVALNWLKRHHFWVLILVAIIVSAVVWNMGSAQLQTETAANAQKIDSQFSSANQIKNKPFHPNDSVNAVQTEENRQLADAVRRVWTALYERQTSEVLKWPTQLRKDFSDAMARLTFGEEILPLMRERYLNYIQRRFPDLPKIIDALELPEEGGGRVAGGYGGGGYGGGMGMEGGLGGSGGRTLSEEELAGQDFIVQWHDQDRVRQELNWDRRPSSIKIWVTQENLWVYETLLRAIAATNKAAGADRYNNAAVRDIFAMQIGQDVNKSRSTGSRIFVPVQSSPGLGGMGMEGGMGMGMEGGYGMGGMGMEGGMGMGMEGGYGMGTDGGEGVDEAGLLLANRYVDQTGAPMTAATDGQFKYGTEYKRLPVRLVLRLDQRWLNRLMIELANAPLQVEVHEVRINPAEGGDFGGRAGRGRGGMSGLGGVGGDGEVLAFNRESNVRDTVIIDGVVYIFYPPDETVLSVESGDNLAGGF